MSASSSESADTKSDNCTESSPYIDSLYALYLFSNNKHASSPEQSNNEKEKVNSKSETKTDCDQPSVCLSLLDGNLGAEQETIVRCYLLKILSAREDISFENEGKYSVLRFSDSLNASFGCYYHRLSKYNGLENTEASGDTDSSKAHTFFICLIGPANGIMESYCAELGNFCFSLVPLLDPEGLKNKHDVQLKLKSWYSQCMEYILRCVQKFQDDLATLFLCALWGYVEVVCEDENLRWDIERFIETSSVLFRSPEVLKLPTFIKGTIIPIVITVVNGRITTDKPLENHPVCVRWAEKLKMCPPRENIFLHNLLEGFKLKTIQDLNTLKRFLQKSRTDHYSLYKAFHFTQNSGYEDLLLYHAKREAFIAGEEECLEIIACLQDYMKNKPDIQARDYY